jgi:hypothetical protein
MAEHGFIPTITDPDAAIVFLLLAAYFFGLTIGVVLAISRASLFEDQQFTLTGRPPGPLALGARTILAAGGRGSGFISDRRRRPEGRYAEDSYDETWSGREARS